MKTEEDRIAAAKREIAEEDAAAEERRKNPTPQYQAAVAENNRRSSLPPEHPEHTCGMMCDGQDGSNSYCYRIREKLGYTGRR